jgi:hypothetical protein
MNHIEFKGCIDGCNNIGKISNTQIAQTGFAKNRIVKHLSKFLALAFFVSCLLFSTTSCIVVSPSHHDSGKHKGWFKNSNNPHNPYNSNENSKENNSKNKSKKH